MPTTWPTAAQTALKPFKLLKELLMRLERVPKPNTASRCFRWYLHGLLSRPHEATDNPLDVAIQGDGFFVVDTAEGPWYTRNGAFVLNDKRQLTTVSGELVQGTGGAIEVPEGAVININQSGAVTSGPLEIGRIRVVQFDDPQLLDRIGHNLYAAGDGVDAKDLENASVLTGALERSNVNMIREMTSLIKVSRFYESFNKAIQTYRTVDGSTARELGR